MKVNIAELSLDKENPDKYNPEVIRCLLSMQDFKEDQNYEKIQLLISCRNQNDVFDTDAFHLAEMLIRKNNEDIYNITDLLGNLTDNTKNFNKTALKTAQILAKIEPLTTEEIQSLIKRTKTHDKIFNTEALKTLPLKLPSRIADEDKYEFLKSRLESSVNGLREFDKEAYDLYNTLYEKSSDGVNFSLKRLIDHCYVNGKIHPELKQIALERTSESEFLCPILLMQYINPKNKLSTEALEIYKEYKNHNLLILKYILESIKCKDNTYPQNVRESCKKLQNNPKLHLQEIAKIMDNCKKDGVFMPKLFDIAEKNLKNSDMDRNEFIALLRFLGNEYPDYNYQQYKEMCTKVTDKYRLCCFSACLDKNTKFNPEKLTKLLKLKEEAYKKRDLLRTADENLSDEEIEEFFSQNASDILLTAELISDAGLTYLFRFKSNGFEKAKQNTVKNLEKDLNDELFNLIPSFEEEKIYDALQRAGITVKTNEETTYEGDGFAAGTKKVKRLYYNNQPLQFETLEKALIAIKEEMNKNEFWSKDLPDKTQENARDTIYTHIVKMRIPEADNTKKMKNSESVNLEVHKTDMNNISHALFLGNHAACCTAVDNSNGWSAPQYIMNKLVSSIEVMDGAEFVGNTMCYFAKVDGKLALVLDNIEMNTKYQYNDKIKNAIIEYAKKLCKETGKPNLPIYAGPNRHKIDMNEFPMQQSDVQIIGSTGDEYISTTTQSSTKLTAKVSKK